MELGPVSHGSQWPESSSVELVAFSHKGALSSNPFGQPQHVASTSLVVVSDATVPAWNCRCTEVMLSARGITKLNGVIH